MCFLIAAVALLVALLAGAAAAPQSRDRLGFRADLWPL